jgi:hypothetical protein
MKKSTDQKMLYDKQVICELSLLWCPQKNYCDGAKPHLFQKDKCGKCPIDKDTVCVEYKEKRTHT